MRDFARSLRRGYFNGVVQDSEPCGVPKFGAHYEKSPICRQDANFGTPQGKTPLGTNMRASASQAACDSRRGHPGLDLSSSARGQAKRPTAAVVVSIPLPTAAGERG